MDAPESPLRYKIANTFDERCDAYRLVYRSYLSSGLCESNPYELRVTPFHLLRTTVVFIAELEGEVVSTVSLIVDGELGLPMESTYGRTIDARRTSGLLVGEISCLADRRKSPRRFLATFTELTRLVAQYARSQGLHQMLLAAHPRHARFYTRYLGFQPIGGLTACPHVRDNPAVALCLDFDEVDRNPPACYDSFFAEAIPSDELVAIPSTVDELDLLRECIDPAFQQPAPANESSPLLTAILTSTIGRVPSP